MSKREHEILLNSDRCGVIVIVFWWLKCLIIVFICCCVDAMIVLVKLCVGRNIFYYYSLLLVCCFILLISHTFIQTQHHHHDTTHHSPQIENDTYFLTFFHYIASFFIIGHLCTRVGRKCWYVVGWNFVTFVQVSLGETCLFVSRVQ